MEKSFKAACVLIPPIDLWASIQAIREKHDRKIGRWMPHITLLYPFLAPPDSAGVKERLSMAAATIPPFELTLGRFGHFNHGRGRYTVWLAPEPEEPLERLDHALCEAFPECPDQQRGKEGFTPHLSVGQFHGKVGVQGFKRERKRSWEPLSFPVKEICVIEREDPPDDVFRLLYEVPLGPGMGETEGSDPVFLRA